jgi:uncharacterized protein (TIGR00290 family)
MELVQRYWLLFLLFGSFGRLCNFIAQMEINKTYFNWSTGKDSAMALHKLLQDDSYGVDYLLTSVNAHHDRVSMHGLRRELLVQQLAAIGLPFGTIELPQQPTNEEYEDIMRSKVGFLQAGGFTHAAFGDIFLADLRKYREEQLASVNIKAVFPLWGRDTGQLMQEFVASGFRAVVVCVNGAVLDRSFAGREVDEAFLNDLPPGVDPCGENGEFHTFCFDAPFFRHRVAYTVGETVYREYDNEATKHGFWFTDLLPQT